MRPAAKRRNLTPEEIRPWLRDLSQNPPDENELLDDPDLLTNPRFDPELALRLDEDGTPMWWPASHVEYEDGRTLTMAERREWFLDYLAGVLSPLQATLRNGDASLRRRLIAGSLCRIASTFEPNELPIPPCTGVPLVVAEPSDADILDALGDLGPAAVARALRAAENLVPADDWNRNFLASAFGEPGLLRMAVETHPNWFPDIGFPLWSTEFLDIVADVTGLETTAWVLQWMDMRDPGRLAKLSAQYLTTVTGRPTVLKLRPETPVRHGDPAVIRAGAVQFLRDSLDPDSMLEIFDSLQRATKEQWAVANHFGLGMAVRNALRAAGFTEAALGIDSLDNAWVDLVWDAVSG